MDLGTLLITMGVNTAGLNIAQAALVRFQGTATASMDRTAAALDRTSIRFQRFGSMATMYMTLPLVAVGAGAIKMASDLEFASQKIVALAGISQSTMNAWQSDITRIGAQTGRSSKEIAEALYYTASAGIKTEEAMNIVELSAKGAASGMGDTDVIARLLTYQMNAYGAAAMKSSRVMDVLSVAIREGTAEASTMVSVLGDLLPVASQMGVSFDQVAGTMAAMTQTGFNAAKAATSLRQIMVSLLDPSKQAREALAMIATETGDASLSVAGLRKTIRDGGLYDALEKVDKIAKMFGEDMAGIIFGNVRALTGQFSLVGANADHVRQILKATREETGTFATVFTIMTDTMNKKLADVKTAAQQALIGLGQSMMGPLVGVLKSVTEGIRSLTTWYKSLSAGTQEVILYTAGFLAIMGPVAIALSLLIRTYGILRLAIISLSPALTLVRSLLLATATVMQEAFAAMSATVIPRVAAAFQGLSVSISTFASSSLRGFPLLQTAMYGVGSAMASLNAIMLANPLTFMLAAVVALGAAFYFLTKRTEESTAAQDAFNEINKTASQAVVDETVKIQQLARIAGSEYASKQMKAEAIKTINALSPEYLGGIRQEAINSGEAKNAIDKYIASLREKALLQAATTALMDEEKSRVNALATGQDRQVGTINKIKDVLLDWVSLQKIGTNQIAEENANAKEANTTYNQRISLFQQQIDLIHGIESARAKEATLDGTMVTRTADAYKYVDVLQLINDKLNERTTVAGPKPNSYIDPNLDADNAAKAAKLAEDAKNAELEKGLKARELMEAKAANRKSVEDIWKKYGEGLREVQQKTELFGGVIDSTGKKFDSSAAYVNLYSSTLEDLLKYVNASDPSLKKLIDNLSQFNGVTGYSKTVMRDLKESLAQVDSQVAQSGGTYNGVEDKMRAYSEAQKKLSDAHISTGVAVETNKRALESLGLQLSGSNLTKSLASIALQEAVLGDRFDGADEKINAHKTRITELTAAMQTYMSQGKGMQVLVLGFEISEEKQAASLAAVEGATKRYKDSIDLASLSQKIWGTSFDGASVKIQANEAFINTLIGELKEMRGNIAATAIIQKQLNEAMDANFTLRMDGALAEYNRTLQENTDKQLTAGKSFNLARENANAYIVLLEAYRKIAVDAGKSTEELDAQLKKLGSANVDAQGMSAFEKRMKAIAKIASVVGGEINNFLGAWTGLITQQQTNAISAVEKSAKAQGKSEAWLAKEKEKINFQYNKKKRAMALAEAMVNTAMAVTNVISNVPFFLWPVAIPLALATGALQIATIRATPMKTGGTIPDGYSNRSYPVLLTSGERVIPKGANKNDNISKVANLTNITSQGMMVPSGYPNDSYPTWLSSGDTVLPVNYVSTMNNMKDQSSSLSNIQNQTNNKNNAFTNITNQRTIETSLFNKIQDNKISNNKTYLEKIPHLAKGGIVPSGYSNDSYPALLSSGEMVTPPIGLGKVNTEERQFKPLKFTIEGRTIVALLEEMNTLNNSY